MHHILDFVLPELIHSIKHSPFHRLYYQLADPLMTRHFFVYKKIQLCIAIFKPFPTKQNPINDPTTHYYAHIYLTQNLVLKSLPDMKFPTSKYLPFQNYPFKLILSSSTTKSKGKPSTSSIRV